MLQGLPIKEKPLDVTDIFKPKKYTRMQAEREISLRMRELYEVLEADYDEPSPVSTKVKYLAMLGAMGRLFEELLCSKQKIGKLIFPFEMLNGFRSVIYHVDYPFRQLKDDQMKRFFQVVYTYCQHELNEAIGQNLYPKLSEAVDMSVIDKPDFTHNIEYVIAAGKPGEPKTKTALLSKLVTNLHDLDSFSQYFRENPGYLLNDDSTASLYRANVVRASVVGTIIAWMNLDTTLLLNKPGMALTQSERNNVIKQYAFTMKPGRQYRHEGLSINSLNRSREVNALSSAALERRIEKAVQKCDVEKVKKLMPMWKKHPSVVKSIDLKVGDWIMQAAKRGNLPLVIYLYSQCIRNSDRVFGFVEAAKYGRIKIVKWYFQNGILSSDLLNYALQHARERQQHKTEQLLKEYIGKQKQSQTGVAKLDCLIQQFQDLMTLGSNEESQDSPSLFSSHTTIVSPGYNHQASSSSSLVMSGLSYAEVATSNLTLKNRV